MATDIIRVSTHGRAATGTYTADVYPANSLTPHSTGLTVTVSSVAGIYTFSVVSPSAGTLYRYILRDSGLSPTWAVDGYFIAKNDGSTIDEVESPNVNVVAWNALTTVALPATPTNITAGTITTVTNLTNAPTAGDLTATMKVSVTTAATAATPIAASVTGAVGSVTAGVTVTTNNDKTDYALSSAGVLAIWNVLTSSLSAVASIGKRIVDNVLQTGDSYARMGSNGASLTGLASATSLTVVEGKVDNVPTVSEFNARTLVAASYFDPSADTVTVGTNNDKTGYTLSSAGVQAIWDALTSALTTVGSIGKRIVDNVLQTGDSFARIGATGSGLTSLASQTSVNIIDDFLDTEIAAIKAKTDNIPTDPADASDIAASFVTVNTKLDTIDDLIDTEVGAIKTKTDQLVFTVAGQVDANSLTGGGGLDAAATRAALGLGSANLDTQLADIPTVSEFNARSIVSTDYFVVTDYTAPANSDIAAILVDTNELQTNQGNWLTATGFSTHSAVDVWAVGTRTLTGFGTLVADVVSGVWAAATRTLTAFGFTPSLHADYDAAKTAASQTSVDDLPTSAELVTALAAADDAVLAVVATRASQASLDTLDDLVDTEVAAIKAKTDQLTFTVANQVDSNSLTGTGLTAAQTRSALGLAFANLDTQLAAKATQTSVDTIDDFLDTEVAAIKAKTDNLPSDPASQATVLAAITSATSPLATQVSVNDLPTSAELATALGTADDAVLAAIAALNNLSSVQVTTLLTTLKSDLATDHGSGAWTTANVASLATAASVAAVKADTLIAKNAGVVILGTISNAGTATEQYIYGGTTVTYAGLDEDGNRSGVTIT